VKGVPPAVDWPWLLVPLAGLLPLVGVVLAWLVARRWGWQRLLEGSVLWGALGFALFAALNGDTLAEAVGISVWLFVAPWLLGGAVTLVVRQRRERRRISAQR